MLSRTFLLFVSSYMRQTAANRAPYIESSKVIDAYGNEMQNCIDHHQDHIAHIGVLGSLGTGW
jgi:hypothetical protein